MPFPFRFARLSGTLASPLVVLALHAGAEQLDPPQMVVENDATQEGGLTPMDQGTRPEDVRITQSVRQALTSSDTLSGTS